MIAFRASEAEADLFKDWLAARRAAHASDQASEISTLTRGLPRGPDCCANRRSGELASGRETAARLALKYRGTPKPGTERIHISGRLVRANFHEPYGVLGSRMPDTKDWSRAAFPRSIGRHRGLAGARSALEP
jgi:hypothetical protein